MCWRCCTSCWRWGARRDWRSGAVVVAYLAGWAPWLFYQQRTIFTFYSVAYVPFVALALAMTLGTVLGPVQRVAEPARDRGDGHRDRRAGRRRRGVLVLPGVVRRGDPVRAVEPADVAADLGLTRGAGPGRRRMGDSYSARGVNGDPPTTGTTGVP